jgi:hypothetical protein
LSRPVIFSLSGADRDQPLDVVADRGLRRLKHADQAADDDEAGLLDFLGERHPVATSRRL